ncbi:MAG: tRNA 2-thiouridine(34) synthase MnmA [Ruminococcaceae bacterium]|nr:tRNA 2-thiouridine(34) synthase MnmA [Oscillospiraceae bacterium]
MSHKKALIAMSGGVDSSVAAYLTMQAGFDCIGATMRLYEPEPNSCPQQVQDAQSVADRLGIPFHVFDLKDAFRCHVMDAFVRAYEGGETPNPCVECNRHLKFGLLLDHARELGCDYVVTGHYARIARHPETGRLVLQKAQDEAKDQSYFLYALTQEQLSRILFPLGELTKAAAREIAEKQCFITARKKDSQDICFIPDGDYPAFMQCYTGHTYPAGNFLDLNGNVVGTHRGAYAYTLGQRKGLGIAMGAPVYVCRKDMAANTVTVGPEEALMHTTLLADDWYWQAFETLDAPLHVSAKARSRMTEQPATVYPEENGMIRLVFDEPQRAITPGQAVVLYDGDTVIGGGTIRTVL